MHNFYNIFLLLFLALNFSACQPQEPNSANDEQALEKQNLEAKADELRPIRVLSLDGGGIRGLIPAHVLSDLEQKLQKPVHKIFDLVAGTSTGGLIALLLTSPNEKKTGALMSAQEIKRFYMDRAEDIFKGNYMIWAAGRSIFGNIYDASGLENLITGLVGDRKYNTSLIPTLLTGFDIVHKKGIDFNSDDKEIDHLTILEVGRATSAAPTYFAPKILKLKNRNNILKDYYIADGGLYKNNPSVLAFRRALEIFGEEAIEKRGLQLVSIGTGAAGFNKTKGKDFLNAGAATWAPAIIDGLIDGSVDEEDKVMRLFAKNKAHIQYFRLQAKLRNKAHKTILELDNISEENMQNLIDAGSSLMKSSIYDSTIKALKQVSK